MSSGFEPVKDILSPNAPWRDLVNEEPRFTRLYAHCTKKTMTGVDRIYALHSATRYVIEAKVEGAFVECGVWKGGSMMMVAHTLKDMGVTDRKLWLYDTYEGMTDPSEVDVDWIGRSGAALMETAKAAEGGAWARAQLDEVTANMESTGYPMSQMVFCRGNVLETIPAQGPESIALLRLDTDWYESTKHELVHLFPRLSPRGVLIVDDYGHFKGARKAVDEYFGSLPEKYLMHRIDYSGRTIVKV